MPYDTKFVEPIGRSAAKDNLTPAGAWLVRHRRVSSNIANQIAELAGFHPEVRDA